MKNITAAMNPAFRQCVQKYRLSHNVLSLYSLHIHFMPMNSMVVSVLNLFIDKMGAVVSGNDAHMTPDNDMHDSMGEDRVGGSRSPGCRDTRLRCA